jgi:hypothetical protein
MPGVFGCAGRWDGGRFDAAVGKLTALPGAASERFQPSEWVALASIGRGNGAARAASSYASDDRAAVLLHGTMLRDDPPRRLAAGDLLAAMHDGRLVEAVADCDGGFAVVAIDLAARRVTVVADRLGSHPLYYAQGDGRFAFGPEAKAVLTAVALAPRYARAGLFEFLTLGHNLADTTLFEGVSYLEPGTVLTHDLREGRTSVRRYWALQFAPERRHARRAVAEEALLDAVLRSHRLLVADRPDHQILLSGGLDSRGMLAALQRVGAPPRQAVSWGASKDVPCSDANIAERLARAFRVPFRFLPYTAVAFADNASEWAYRSELANDNSGWYGEGLGSLRDFYAAGAPVSFIGDEVWGTGGRLVEELQFADPFPKLLAGVLRPRVAEEARATYEARLARVMAPCLSRDLGDRRDFFYLYGRSARFIMSLGYYKEHATELRRPFLTRAVLRVVSGLPERYRRYKNLYSTMLTRFFPQVMRYPNNIVSSLPDWAYDVRRDPRLSGYVRGLLEWAELERGPVADLVDRGSFEALRDRWFSAAAAPLSRRCSPWNAAARVALYRSRLLTRANTFRKSLSSAPPAPDATREFDLLRRVALLVLLQRRFGDLASC